MKVTKELQKGSEFCEKGMIAKVLYMHADMRKKYMYHHALFLYLNLLFGKRNVLKTGCLRIFNSNLHKSVVEVYYNKDTAFTEDELKKLKENTSGKRNFMVRNCRRVVYVPRLEVCSTESVLFFTSTKGHAVSQFTTVGTPPHKAKQKRVNIDYATSF